MKRKNMDRLLMLAMPNDGGGDGAGAGGSGDGAGTGGGAGAGAGTGGAAGSGAGGGGGAGPGDKGGDGAGGPGTDEFKSPESKAAVLKDLNDVREENRRLKEANDAYENEKLSDDQKRDRATQKANDDRDAAVAEAAEQRQRADRYEAAEKAGLELKFAKRISGATLEEMVADATELAKEFGTKKGAGEYTPGAGTSGDGGAALTSPGVGTLDSYYASKK